MEVYSWENHGKSTITAINDGVLASHVWLRGCIHPIVSLSHSHNAPIQLGSVMEQSHVLWEDLDYIRIPRDSHQFIDGFYSHFVRIPMAWIDDHPTNISIYGYLSYPHIISPFYQFNCWSSSHIWRSLKSWRGIPFHHPFLSDFPC